MGTGLLTAIVAILGAVIAYFQFITARRKLMLDLFDRRLKVIEGIERVQGYALAHAEIDADRFNDFLSARAAARFLFDDDVQKYMQELQDDFAFLNVYDHQTIGDPALQDRVNVLRKRTEIMKQISRSPQKTAEIFGPYMKFTEKQTKAWLPW